MIISSFSITFLPYKLQKKCKNDSELYIPKFNFYSKLNSVNKVTFNCEVTLFIIWLAPRAGKMNQIICCDWLPKPSCPLGATCCIPQAKFPPKSFNKSFIEQVCLVKMAGYWTSSFFTSLWTSTSSQSINTQKRTWTISSHLDLTLGQ